jgi:hypothetical protein
MNRQMAWHAFTVSNQTIPFSKLLIPNVVGILTIRRTSSALDKKLQEVKEELCGLYPKVDLLTN